MFRCGLIVGKFSPLHRGHQYLIGTALSQCKRLILLSYSNPEIHGCEAPHREQWLCELYPQTTRLVVNDRWLADHFGNALAMPTNNAPDDEHREFVFRLLNDVLQREVDVVFTSESYGDGFAEYLQTRSARVRTVKHVLVDMKRARVPISGTSIRDDVHAHREWLDPAVYASFVERIAILGGESSGKSTLARELAAAFHTLHCAEYGRDLWVERGGQLQFDDMLTIARTQIEREHSRVRRANRYLFCDTSPLTTLFYCEEMFRVASPELRSYADRPYSHTILCAPDFPFAQDGTRRDAAFRDRQHAWYKRELEARATPYLEVSGELENRVRTVREYLSGARLLP